MEVCGDGVGDVERVVQIGIGKFSNPFEELPSDPPYPFGGVGAVHQLTLGGEDRR